VLSLIGIRYLATRNPETRKPDVPAIFVSLVSFLIYAAALLAFDVLFNTDESTTHLIATVVVFLWMGILTAFVGSTLAP